MDPLEEQRYVLVHVKCVSPCELQVPGISGGKERGLEELLASLEGGNHEVNASECIYPVDGRFGPLLEPLE